MHPNGVRQDRRGPIRTRHHTHGPHSNPRTNGPCFVGDRILFNPVGVSIAESSTPQGTAPRPTGPWSRTLGFGVPPRCGDEMHTSGCGWPPGCGDETPTLRMTLAGRHVVVNTPFASVVTQRAPGRFSWRHGVHPEGFTTTWWHPKAQGSAPTPQGVGAEPWGRVRRRECTLTGCDKTDVAPFVHVTTLTSPIPTRGRIGPRCMGRPHFVPPRSPLRSPNRRRPRVRLPGPRGRGAGPWALECHHVVVMRCTRTVSDGHHVVVKTRTLETRGAGYSCHARWPVRQTRSFRRATRRATRWSVRVCAASEVPRRS